MTQLKNLLLSLVLTFWAVALYAGDEDMSPSAYHVFDPETGYMVTVDPMDEEQQDAMPAAVDTPEAESTAPSDWRLLLVILSIGVAVAIWLHKKRVSRQ